MHGFQNNLAQLFISTPLRSKGVVMLYPGVRMCVRARIGALGLLGSVFAFMSNSQQL